MSKYKRWRERGSGIQLGCCANYGGLPKTLADGTVKRRSYIGYHAKVGLKRKPVPNTSYYEYKPPNGDAYWKFQGETYYNYGQVLNAQFAAATRELGFDPRNYMDAIVF